MPLISVIIPAYNAEKTIQETIESVLKQTFSDFELILINDGSCDSTLDIVESIQAPRLKVLSYTNSGSVAVSRNRGLSHASGEFIAFLDADDLWTPDKLEAQLSALQQNPQAAVAYSWVDRIDESGKFLRHGRRVNLTGDVYAELLLGNFLQNGSNPLIRKQALCEVGGFDESLLNAEDQDLYLRLAARYHFVAVPSTQILYRISSKSKSANVSRLEGQALKVIERGFEQAPESLQHLKKHSLTNLYIYLTRKALEGSPGREKGLKAARFFWHYFKNDPSRFQKMRFKLSLLSKIVSATLLPPRQT